MVKREILSASGSMMFVRVELPKGFVGEIDQHPEEQISYIEKGSVVFEVEGTKRLLESGDVQYIQPNAPHQVEVLKECVILDVFSPIRKDLLPK